MISLSLLSQTADWAIAWSAVCRIMQDFDTDKLQVGIQCALDQIFGIILASNKENVYFCSRFIKERGLL